MAILRIVLSINRLIEQHKGLSCDQKEIKLNLVVSERSRFFDVLVKCTLIRRSISRRWPTNLLVKDSIVSVSLDILRYTWHTEWLLQLSTLSKSPVRCLFNMPIKRHYWAYSGVFIPFKTNFPTIRNQSIDFTAQKMKFSFKDFFSKCDQIRMKLRIRPYLLKKFLM